MNSKGWAVSDQQRGGRVVGVIHTLVLIYDPDRVNFFFRCTREIIANSAVDRTDPGHPQENTNGQTDTAILEAETGGLEGGT